MNDVEELRYLILALQREGNRRFAAGLRPLDLTPAQGEALSLIATHEPMTLNGLGGLLVCDSGTNPSRIVDRLAASGLVERETDPDDRRQVRLTVTPLGRDRAAQVHAVEDELDGMLAELVGDQPTEPALTLLRSMAAHFPAGRALQRRQQLTAHSP
ncbi:DNA-binding MarR family transcriptional regulator [Haloactinopolyspora alba]|uniref:DNA-binding MarR family transcriptional regulator n=1 Tax=Haloactinopolyspora alba TaxID=648780 RepID=A0A2P8E0Z0_9ACTN|nr:MarR family transcriptional regulator [Haloactinopolyspora alba]PSL03135.1 DNA-binding MarR family transcriptional regulator [Haloactinopolyspora alba]